MPTTQMPLAACTLTLTGDERNVLVRHLEQALREKAVEEHRTGAFDFKQRLAQEEAMMQNEIAKLRGTGARLSL